MLGEASVGTSALGVILSLDDKYVFVNQEYGPRNLSLRGAIEVFKTHRTSNGSISGQYIGYAALGDAVAGSALSTDGTKLYATSETAIGNSSYGTLSVLDVEALKSNSSNAILGVVDAGSVS